MDGKPWGKAGVGAQETLHLQGVSRQDQNKILPVILHRLHQGVDGLLAKILFPSPGQGVGFVNEEDSAQGPLHVLPGLLGRMPDIFVHQIRPFHFHQVPFRQNPHLLEQLTHDAGHRRFARPGITAEHHVQNLLFRGEAGGGAAAPHLQPGINLAHKLLHSAKSDQLVQGFKTPA